MDLTIIWAGILAFAVFAYVVMDGFDLGIGILFPFLSPGKERDNAMNSVAPVWDGNETWLVLGGGGLFAAFPLAYAVMMPALYAPLMMMLLGLVFRGIAFEYRWRIELNRWLWDIAFAGGSLLAALSQGIMLGAILQGISVSGRHYAGGNWDWLSPFSLLTGISVVVGYALLGATWLIMKTEDELLQHAFRLAKFLGWCLLAAIVAVSIATPFLNNIYYKHWFAWPSVLLSAQVPLLVAIAAFLFFRSLREKHESAPFLIALCLFGISFIGLCISIFPYVVPNQITIWQAAAPESSQIFMLIGTGVLIPMILAYTGHAYWVFRGKVGEGYH